MGTRQTPLVGRAPSKTRLRQIDELEAYLYGSYTYDTWGSLTSSGFITLSSGQRPKGAARFERAVDAYWSSRTFHSQFRFAWLAIARLPARRQRILRHLVCERRSREVVALGENVSKKTLTKYLRDSELYVVELLWDDSGHPLSPTQWSPHTDQGDDW